MNREQQALLAANRIMDCLETMLKIYVNGLELRPYTPTYDLYSVGVSCEIRKIRMISISYGELLISNGFRYDVWAVEIIRNISGALIARKEGYASGYTPNQ